MAEADGSPTVTAATWTIARTEAEPPSESMFLETHDLGESLFENDARQLVPINDIKAGGQYRCEFTISSQHPFFAPSHHDIRICFCPFLASIFPLVLLLYAILAAHERPQRHRHSKVMPLP